MNRRGAICVNSFLSDDNNNNNNNNTADDDYIYHFYIDPIVFVQWNSAISEMNFEIVQKLSYLMKSRQILVNSRFRFLSTLFQFFFFKQFSISNSFLI